MNEVKCDEYEIHVLFFVDLTLKNENFLLILFLLFQNILS